MGNNRKKSNIQNQKTLAQHFTPNSISELMVMQIPIKNPKCVVDLAVGKGELLTQFKHKWPNCTAIGFDIDNELVKLCKSNSKANAFFYCMNSLKVSLTNIKETISSLRDSVDVVISNPPYGVIPTIDIDTGLRKKLVRHNLVTNKNSKHERVRTEIAFLIKNLQILRNHGYLAILLPENMLSGLKNRPLRQFLLNHNLLECVLSLPPDSFTSSEARINIIVIRKQSQSYCRLKQETVNVGFARLQQNSISVQKINKKDLLDRMDPNFIYMNNGLKDASNGWKPLNEYVDSCNRGYGIYGDEKRVFRLKEGISYLRSVDITHFMITMKNVKKIPEYYMKSYPSAVTQYRDILFVRVGSSCVGRTAILNSVDSIGIASDCLFVIRSIKLDPLYLCLYLNTRFAKKYLNSRMRGICSRYITKTDLLSLPIFLPDIDMINDLSSQLQKSLITLSNNDNTKTHQSVTASLISQLDIAMSEHI